MSAPTTTKPVRMTCDDDYDPYVAPTATITRTAVHVNKHTKVVADRREYRKGEIATLVSFECPKGGGVVDVWIPTSELMRVVGEIVAAQDRPVVD